jgi:hypothetical protein
MKYFSAKIRGALLFLILVLLFIPLIQGKFNLIKLTPLKGAISQPEKKYFSIAGWFSGIYQEQEEKYLNETFGFRSLFIRINNQLAFNLFNKAKANSVIVGKKNYLFEENYIKAYYGIDYIGYDSIAHRMQRLKYIQDTLTKLNKNIILVFAAGKGSFYHEYFPDSYKNKNGITNYETHIEFAKKLGLNFIDFNRYFIDNKDKSKYPLYPQYGIHWSYYGMCLAADSIIRHIEKVRNIDMPNLFWNEIEFCEYKKGDYDIADGMNILFKLHSFKMAYPKIQFQSESGKTKPSVLVISDSFYWGLYDFGISNAFSTSHFWFYNKQIYPESFKSPLETNQVNLKEAIDQHDVIIILATEATLPGFGWGFIENTFNLFKGIKIQPSFDAEFQRKILNLRNYIKTDKNWMEQIEKKAVLNKVSIDSMITLDAIWQIQNEK